MARDAMIRARMEASLKAEVEEILKKLGLTATEAINLFYYQIKLRKGLPFKVEMPNEETEHVLDNTRKGKDLHSYDSIDELFEDLDR